MNIIFSVLFILYGFSKNVTYGQKPYTNNCIKLDQKRKLTHYCSVFICDDDTSCQYKCNWCRYVLNHKNVFIAQGYCDCDITNETNFCTSNCRDIYTCCVNE